MNWPLNPQSKRTPHISTQFNMADQIERALQEDGHRTWGFIIYRCTYASDSDWAEFMEILRSNIHRVLTAYNGLELLESLDMIIVEDSVALEGASTSIIREKFKEWASTSPQREQGEPPRDPDWPPVKSQRYRYCVMVDSVALESVLEADPHDYPDGLVNLIWKDWEPETPHPREPTYEPLEGCTLQDVGWMRVAYRNVTVEFYDRLREYSD